MTLTQIGDLTRYTHEAQLLAQDLAAASKGPSARSHGTDARRVWATLIESAVRVLTQAATASAPSIDKGQSGPSSSPTTLQSPAHRLWELTCGITALSAQSDMAASLDEAVAALQTSTCVFAEPEADVVARMAILRKMRPEAPSRLRVEPNGPYLGLHIEKLTNWLGTEIAVPPLVALCRCGGSAIKPFCDGAHAQNHFNDAKDPNRVGDRQDAYVGQQLTVLDNRGTCAHSGFCTDRLATVFHQGKEPFVSPSGARMDAIIRAVRACPSGALSFAIDGHQTRDHVDTVRPPAIEVSKDGPYRVTGGVPIVDRDGAPIQRNIGASLEHYSLCRCGHSQNKPFCSGMHWTVHFRDPAVSAEHEPTLFEWAGGLPALTRMTTLFYSKYVPEDPLVGPLFASMAPDHAERVASWLGEVFGGPKRYSEQYGGYTRMLSQHLGKGLTEAQRARWVALMCQAAEDAGLPADPEFRAAFVAYLEWGSRLALENSQPGAKPPARMPVPRWWWVCDATPGSRVSAVASEVEQEVVLPGTDESVTFEAHVRPLFRQVDRQSMLFAFDLWAHDNVARHASEILRRLESGTMPCDGAWPTAKVDVFRRWVDSGMPA